MPRPWPGPTGDDNWKSFIVAFDPHGLLNREEQASIRQLYSALVLCGFQPQIGFSARLGSYRRRWRD